MRLIFKSVKIEKNRLFSVMTVEHIQSAEGLNRANRNKPSLSKRETSSSMSLDFFTIGSPYSQAS